MTLIKSEHQKIYKIDQVGIRLILLTQDFYERAIDEIKFFFVILFCFE
jgi:hypothetical protein